MDPCFFRETATVSLAREVCKESDTGAFSAFGATVRVCPFLAVCVDTLHGRPFLDGGVTFPRLASAIGQWTSFWSDLGFVVV